MTAPIPIQFVLDASLADKARVAGMGIWDPSQLAKRVYQSWLSGSPMRRGFVPEDVKISILDAFETARQEGTSVEAFLFLLHEKTRVRIARGTLYNWKRKRDAGGDDALADHRRGNGPRDWSTDPFMQEAKRLRVSPERPSIAECHRRAVEAAGRNRWDTRSDKQVARYLRAALGKGPRGTAPLDWSSDPFMQEARRLRRLPDHPTIKECHRRASEAAASHGWKTWDFKRTDRYLRSVRELDRLQTGPSMKLHEAF